MLAGWWKLARTKPKQRFELPCGVFSEDEGRQAAAFFVVILAHGWRAKNPVFRQTACGCIQCVS